MVSIAGKTRLLHSRDPLQMTGCGIEWNVDLQASVHVSESMYTTVERHYAHPNLILIVNWCSEHCDVADLQWTREHKWWPNDRAIEKLCSFHRQYLPLSRCLLTLEKRVWETSLLCTVSMHVYWLPQANQSVYCMLSRNWTAHHLPQDPLSVDEGVVVGHYPMLAG